MVSRSARKRVEDDGDVDELLEDRAPHGRQVAERGDDHRGERQADADDDALERDAAAAARDDDRLAEPVEAIDGENDVGRFRGRGRAAGTDGDPDVGERERRRVVDAVADHDRVTGALFEPDRLDLLGWRAVREHVVDADDGTDRLRVLLSVAGHHDDAADAVTAQLADRACRVGPDRIVEQQCTDRARRRRRRRS